MNRDLCIALFMLVVTWTFIFVSAVRGFSGEELYDYKVYGQNKYTGLVVVGHMWEMDKEGNIKAKVYDEMQIYDQCWGAWVGYGVAQVGCENGNQYILEVIEE